MEMNRFRERLKDLRRERNITQVKLGKYLDFGYTAIANYENGRNEPSIDTLIKIAKFFDVSVDYLLGCEEKQKYGFSITKQEEELLGVYSKLREDQKGIVINLLRSMTEKENLP